MDTLVVVTGFPAQACDNLARVRPNAGCGREASGRRSFLVHGSRGAGRTWPWSPPPGESLENEASVEGRDGLEVGRAGFLVASECLDSVRAEAGCPL